MKLFCLLLLCMISAICIAFDQPPQISTPFQDSYYIPEDNDEVKTFQCAATGTPPPTYEWKKDGVTLQNSLQITVDATNGKLTILKAEIQDFGKYQCFAKNRAGIAMSAKFDLERSFIGPFSDTTQITLPPHQQYSNVSIPCNGKPKCRPGNDCKIEWKRGEGTSNTVKETDRIAVDKDGTLHFLYVDVLDQSTQQVPYACGMNNEAMKAFYKGANVVMTVLPVTVPTNFRPLALFSKEVKGLLGSEAELQCVFSGYPVPKISWYAPDGTFINPIDGRYVFRDPSIKRNLLIKNLKASDEGDYKCAAQNPARAHALVYLNVTSKPRFAENELLLSDVVPTGEDAVFRCKMESMRNEKPPTAPVWRRNGELLPENQIGDSKLQKYHLSDDKTVLTIKKVEKPGDSCSIMCQTGNIIFDVNGAEKYVETYADALLRVIDPIQVDILTSMKMELTTTEAFSIAFRATTDVSIPQLNIKWALVRPDNSTIYDDYQLSTLSFIRFNYERTNLTIIPENAEADGDENKVRSVVGIYRVNISHEYENVVKDFDIYTNLVVATKAPIVTSAGFDLWIIGVILGVIVLLIVIFFIICTLYRNRGGEYPVDKKEVAAGHDPEKELKDSGFADLSRADGEKSPFDRVSLTDEVKPLESDEDSMMGDYDDEDGDMTKFNEDGSFIGVYMDKKGLLHG